ncbi:hypothetical protein ACRJ4W_03165 [Streptomyces sp. GLT-R25]
MQNLSGQLVRIGKGIRVAGLLRDQLFEAGDRRRQGRAVDRDDSLPPCVPLVGAIGRADGADVPATALREDGEVLGLDRPASGVPHGLDRLAVQLKLTADLVAEQVPEGLCQLQASLSSLLVSVPGQRKARAKAIAGDRHRGNTEIGPEVPKPGHHELLSQTNELLTLERIGDLPVTFVEGDPGHGRRRRKHRDRPDGAAAFQGGCEYRLGGRLTGRRSVPTRSGAGA